MTRLAATLIILTLALGPVFAFAEEEETSEENEEAAVQNGADAYEERIRLEQELAELERQIAEQEKIIAENRREQQTLASEIASLNARIRSVELQIRATDLEVMKLSRQITDTQREINQTEQKITEHRRALSKSLQNLYEFNNQSMVAVLLTNVRLSDFFGNLTNIALVQDTIRLALNDIVKLRQELLNYKEELSLSRGDAQNLRDSQEFQKQRVQGTQNQKSSLLATTRGLESEYRKVLSERQQAAAEIRSRIFQLIGGGPDLTFERAYEIARLAGDATGIRAALILAILDRESAFGRNVGRCTYNQIVPQTGRTVMHPTRDIPVFEVIIATLKSVGTAPTEPIPVSCPILSAGPHGGAMGPTQFIPSTWAIYAGYKKDGSGNWQYDSSSDRVGGITGNKPSNPWNHTDSFVATALYIKELLSSRACVNYSNQIPSIRQTLLERCAASMYYAGGNWERYRWIYGEPVVQKANRFEEDIRIMLENNN